MGPVYTGGPTTALMRGPTSTERGLSLSIARISQRPPQPTPALPIPPPRLSIPPSFSDETPQPTARTLLPARVCGFRVSVCAHLGRAQDVRHHPLRERRHGGAPSHHGAALRRWRRSSPHPRILS